MTEHAIELLRRYVDDRSEDAFAELVRHQLNLVYSAALRQIGGDAHLANDVAQAVFLALAHNARSLARRDSIVGWLYTTTRFIAAKTVRAHRRWQAREHEAQHMRMLTDDSPNDDDWQRLRPVLDETLCELPERDREAILLRYFEGLAHAEIGTRCGLAENAARMRVERALEKLREALARRGITSTAVALGTVLSTHAVTAAPAGAATAITSVALAGAAASSTSASVTVLATQLLEIMSLKLKLGIAGALVAGAAITYVAFHDESRNPAAEHEPAVTRSSVATLPDETSLRELERLRAENQRLRDEATSTRVAAVAANDPNRDAEAQAMQRLGILRDAQKQRLASVRLEMLTPQRQLSDRFAQLFNLTPDERQALQTALDQTKEKLGDQEIANAKVRHEADGRTVIEVQPFAEAGGTIYDEFLKTFASTLGEERNAAFLDLAATQMEEALSGFGAAQRTITVAPKQGRPDDAKNSPQFDLTVDAESPGNHSVHTRGVPDWRTLESEIGALARLLPPNWKTAQR